MKEVILAEGKSILENVDVFNYEEYVDRANDWLLSIEPVYGKEISDEVFSIAQKQYKALFESSNKVTVVPVMEVLEAKVDFFKEKLRDILKILGG
jgi:hypothetical protein